MPVMRRLNRWAWAEILAALMLLVAALASWWTTERRETEAEISYLLSVYGEQMESRLSGMDRTMGILLENGEDLALMGEEQFLRVLRAFGSDRALFGTDSPWGDQAAEVRRFLALPLMPEEKESILSGNARRLLFPDTCA